MSPMGEMPMPGGWSMSMVWMRMPGQTWPGAAASFLGMWVVMMIAMMLPSLAPMLWRYRGRLTALVGVGYFVVWTMLGIAVFPLGVALVTIEMQHPALARAVPIAIGVVVLIAGAIQFTKWKAHHLACCREAPGCDPGLLADAGTAWRTGLRLGVHCSCGCAGLMAILLVVGVMDLRAMAVVTAAITIERVAPAGERVARAIGAVAVGAGLFLIAAGAAQLWSNSVAARLPTFLSATSSARSSSGLSSENTLFICPECFRKASAMRSLPRGVRATIRTRRSSALSTRLTKPFAKRRSTAILIEPGVRSTIGPIVLTGKGPLCSRISSTPKSERPSPVASIPAAAYLVRARIAFIITSQTWSAL
jgi:predicted metal-binding membrane protein